MVRHIGRAFPAVDAGASKVAKAMLGLVGVALSELLTLMADTLKRLKGVSDR